MLEQLLRRLLHLSRPCKCGLMMAADALLLVLVVWGAFSLRMSDPLAQRMVDHWWLLVVLPLVSLPLFYAVGLYRIVLRYMGPQAVLAVFYGVTLSTLAFIAIVAIGRFDGVPRTTIIIYWLLGLLMIGGTRIAARAWFQSAIKHSAVREPVAIYGAGAAGIQLATSLLATREHEPVAFLDDDVTLHGGKLNGIPVFSPKKLGRLVKRDGVKQVLLAIPSASRARRREIVQKLEPYQVHIQTIPGLADIVSGSARVQDIREVEIDDLLGRDSIAPEDSLLDHCIADRVVMVTGAGGSIGSELCRQILARRPRTLILFDQSEFALYRIEYELRAVAQAEGQGTQIVSLLGSVTHQRRVLRTMASYRVETVYHAAAYKHVPIVEENALEGIQNNIFGTLRCAKAAHEARVKWFIFVSTDKAVRPTNVMGASKRFAEMVLQSLAAGSSKTCFAMVRFGNVLDSSGSVVPLFRQQIRSGGPVTVTHQEVTRFFMTIPEAASLVIQAGSMAEGGDVFVLDMGEPVRIMELARRMIHLSGYEVLDNDNPDGDIQIACTGLRAGEKLHEELLLGENVSGTKHPMILRANEQALDWGELSQWLKRLDDACHTYDCALARGVLCESVQGYQAEGQPRDLLWRMDDLRDSRLAQIAPGKAETSAH
ncbi:nucleoside-diphosphate sugar epimerase/dehydratase [Aquisalimonas sp.]|uniref:polysaccharide biosynthesis protein n=1 Tax=Aquisalimonas sp. TaxID=1872621 RepID=UPI0025BD6F83|nr:nucleoside-diphosphate sugar epimerase/dehydratase [Aquisalimonas sp.]